MVLKVICQQCGAKYEVQQNKILEEPFNLSCKRCQHQIVLVSTITGIESIGAKVEPASDMQFPRKLGNFHIVEHLASGGMGEVYLAKLGGAEGFEKEVVLKILHRHLAQDKNFARAIVDEAKLTVLLHHPNIVQMFNLEKTDEMLYCVMEYVPGKSLSLIQRTYRKKGSLIPISMAVYVAIETLKGLDYAHEFQDRQGKALGIVHRDISPENILITADGWVKIIDFGIAKAATRITQTQPGTIKGKFAYMAPEQLQGKADHRADLFSMGVVLWESLAGVRLFYSQTGVNSIQKVLHMDPPSISTIRPEAPKAMDRILEKALAKDPEIRYATARAFQEDLLAMIAPSTVEELRSSVDIEAKDLGPSSSVQTGREEPEDEDLTPVLDPSLTMQYPHVEQAEKTTGWRSVAWLVLALVLLAGLTTSIWLATKPQVPNQQDAKPPIQNTSVAKTEQHSADAGTPVGSGDRTTDTGLDAGLAVAQTKPAVRRSQPLRKLTRGAIEKALYRHRLELQRCADTYLMQDGLGNGVKLVLDFTIDQKGKVTAVGLDPKKYEATLFGGCIRKQVQNLKFRRHQDKKVTIAFPLEFQVVRKP